MDQLREDLKKMEERVLTYNKRESELIDKIEEAHNASFPFKIDFERLKLESETLKQRVQHKEDELNETVLKLHGAQKELATVKLEAEAGREAMQKEVQLSKEAVLTMEQQLESSHKREEKLLEELNQAKKNALDQEMAHEAEIETQTRLVKVQKQLAKVSADHAEDTDKIVAQLQKDLAKAKDAQQAQLEQMEKEVEEKLAEQEKAHAESLGKLKEQLKSAEETVESLRELPLAMKDLSESASNLELAKRGISVTSLYSEVIGLREESARDKAEIKRLNLNLERILADIEKKAPAVAELRQEYERAIGAYDDTSVKLVDVMKDYNSLKASVKAVEDDREEQRMRAAVATQEAKDLAHQVQSLLKSQLRHSAKSLSTPAKKIFPDKAVGSAHEIISENLVPIASVNDLQSKNQQLLRVIRQLTKEREAEESKRSLKAETEVEQKLKTAMQELEDMRESRKRQEEMVTVIIGQRDMYRTLLNQSDAPHSAAAGSAASTNIDAASAIASTPGSPLAKSPMGKALVESAGLNKTLQSTLAEFAQFRAEASQSSAEFSNALKGEREKTAAALLDVSRLTAEADFVKERLEEMKEMLEGERNESVRLREVQSRLEEQVTQQEKLLAERSEDIKAALQRERLLGAESNALKVDKRVLEQEVEQLKQRLKDLKAQLETQESFSKSFQVMESAIKTEQSTTLKALRDDKEALLAQVKRLETEAFDSEKKAAQDSQRLAADNRKLQADIAAEKAQTATLREQLASVNAKLETTISKEKLLRQQLERTNKVAAQVRELRSKQGASTASPVEASTTNSSTSGENIGEDSNVASLREAVAKRAKDVETYKQIASAKEKALQGLEESNRKLSQQLSKQAAKIKSYEDQLASSTAGAKAERAQIESRAAELDASLKEAKAKIGALMAQSKALKEREKSLSDALEASKQRAADLDDRWFKDHERHVADIETLKTLRQTVETLRSENQRLSKEAEELLQSKGRLESKHTGEVAVLEQRISAADSAVEDLRRQNELLTEQLSRLSDQAKILQRQQLERQLSSGEDADAAKKEESAAQKEVARLRELMEIANRHKSVAVLEKEEAQHEVRRLNQQKEAALKEVETLKVQLQAFEGGSKKVLSQSEHQSLLAAMQESVVLRKMQAYMTAEHEELKTKLANATAASKAAQEKAAARDKVSREAQAKARSNEAERAALQREMELYKKRYEELMANFGNKVDPQEHERMKAAKAAMKQQLDGVNAKLVKVQAEMREVKEKVKTQEQEISKHLEMKEKLRAAGTVWKNKYKTLREETEKAKNAQRREADRKASADAAKAATKAATVKATAKAIAKAATGAGPTKLLTKGEMKSGAKRTHSVISSKPAVGSSKQEPVKLASPSAEVGPPKKKGKVVLKRTEAAKPAAGAVSLKRPLPTEQGDQTKKAKNGAQGADEKSRTKSFEKPVNVLLDRQKVIAANKAKQEEERKRRQDEEALKARLAMRRQIMAQKTKPIKLSTTTPAGQPAPQARPAEVSPTAVTAKAANARVRTASAETSQPAKAPPVAKEDQTAANLLKKQQVQSQLDQVRRKLAERKAQAQAQAQAKAKAQAQANAKAQAQAQAQAISTSAPAAKAEQTAAVKGTTDAKPVVKEAEKLKTSRSVDISARIAKLKGEAKAPEKAVEAKPASEMKSIEPTKLTVSLKPQPTASLGQRAAMRLERFNRPVEAKEAKEEKIVSTPIQPATQQSATPVAAAPKEVAKQIETTEPKDSSPAPTPVPTQTPPERKEKPTIAAATAKEPQSVAEATSKAEPEVKTSESKTSEEPATTSATKPAVVEKPTVAESSAKPAEPLREQKESPVEAKVEAKAVEDLTEETAIEKPAKPEDEEEEGEEKMMPSAEITMAPEDIDEEDEEDEEDDEENMMDGDEERSLSEEATDSMPDQEEKEESMEESKKDSDDDMSAGEDEGSDDDENLEDAEDSDKDMEEGEVIVLDSSDSDGAMDDKDEDGDGDAEM